MQVSCVRTSQFVENWQTGAIIFETDSLSGRSDFSPGRNAIGGHAASAAGEKLFVTKRAKSNG